jgi:hypothetical protein
MHRKLWISFGFGLWITGSDWKNRGKKNEKGVDGPFPGYLHISNHQLMP